MLIGRTKINRNVQYIPESEERAHGPTRPQATLPGHFWTGKLSIWTVRKLAWKMQAAEAIAELDGFWNRLFRASVVCTFSSRPSFTPSEFLCADGKYYIGVKKCWFSWQNPEKAPNRVSEHKYWPKTKEAEAIIDITSTFNAHFDNFNHISMLLCKSNSQFSNVQISRFHHEIDVGLIVVDQSIEITIQKWTNHTSGSSPLLLSRAPAISAPPRPVDRAQHTPSARRPLGLELYFE